MPGRMGGKKRTVPCVWVYKVRVSAQCEHDTSLYEACHSYCYARGDNV